MHYILAEVPIFGRNNIHLSLCTHNVCMQHSTFKAGHTCIADSSKNRCIKTHNITSHHITSHNDQCDGYLSGSSLEWVPLLVLSNVWVVHIRVIWFRVVTILFSSLALGFMPSYDMSYAGVPHLEGLQHISNLIHPKLTAHPEAAFKTVVERLV